MGTAKLLLVESRRTNASSYAPVLEKKGYAVHTEHTLQHALRGVRSFSPDIVLIDAVSLRTSGTGIVRALRAEMNGTPILLVTPADASPDPQAGATLVLAQPFTARKLLNGVARLLPADDSECLKVGPVKLNLARRRVSCGSRDDKVTPKQARLLEVFLRNPGQLLTRKYLIRHVWETDFMGDTRTLDVHISWLRRVIEPNPAKPRYLRTVRGIGYRLVIST